MFPANKLQPSYESKFIIRKGNCSHYLDQDFKISPSSHSIPVLVSDVFKLFI